MALSYIYKKYKDVYTIKNTGIVDLQYTIFIKNCDSTKEYKKGTIKVQETFIVPILILDGIYSIKIFTDTEEEYLPDILQYFNLLTAFIKGVEEVLCGCKKCNDCEDCNKCEDVLTIINYGLAYFNVNSPKYNNYLSVFSKVLKCNYSQEILCNILNNTVSGKYEIKNLTKLNLALLYLSFYLLDLAQITDVTEIEYLKDKYKSVKILQCIRKIGVDIDNFNTELFSNMKVYYWQFDNLNDDINTIVSQINNVYFDNKPFLSFEEFSKGHVVNYNLIGRIVFAIKETDILNFILEDSLGNDVTDQFDTHYFIDTHTVVFVSKIHYSHSSIYFKFKKLNYTP